MIYPSIDKLIKNVGSKFLLVNIVSKRVKEIEETSYYLPSVIISVFISILLLLVSILIFNKKKL